jgi:hypothetical protein
MALVTNYSDIHIEQLLYPVCVSVRSVSLNFYCIVSAPELTNDRQQPRHQQAQRWEAIYNNEVVVLASQRFLQEELAISFVCKLHFRRGQSGICWQHIQQNDISFIDRTAILVGLDSMLYSCHTYPILFANPIHW